MLLFRSRSSASCADVSSSRPLGGMPALSTRDPAFKVNTAVQLVAYVGNMVYYAEASVLSGCCPVDASLALRALPAGCAASMSATWRCSSLVLRLSGLVSFVLVAEVVFRPFDALPPPPPPPSSRLALSATPRCSRPDVSVRHAMILSDEKDSPLLPLSTSPPPTNRTTSPPPAHKHGFTLVQAARSFLSGKRRLGIVLSLAVCLVLSLGRYHHSQGGFYPPGNGAEQRPPGGGYQPGDGFESPPIWLGAEAQDAAEAQAKEQKPLTGLGKEADEVYKIDGLNRVAYQEQLESFVRTHFPPADSDEDDPHSLLNDLRRFFHDRSRKGSPRKLPSIPGKLWQTAATHAKYADRQDTTKSFIDMQPHMNITFHDNKQANLWVASRFKMNEPEVPDGAERLPVGIVEAWERLAYVTSLGEWNEGMGLTLTLLAGHRPS